MSNRYGVNITIEALRSFKDATGAYYLPYSTGQNVLSGSAFRVLADILQVAKYVAASVGACAYDHPRFLAGHPEIAPYQQRRPNATQEIATMETV